MERGGFTKAGSRKNVLDSIAHKQPEGLPLDLGATPSSGISAIAYNNLSKALGTYTGKAKVYDVVQQVAQVDDWIIDRFGVDVIDIGRAFNAKPSDWYTVTLPDGSDALYPKWFNPQKSIDGNQVVFDEKGKMIAKMTAGATFFDQTCFPYAEGYPNSYKGLDEAMNDVLWQRLVHSPWDNAQAPDFWLKLREKALFLRKTTDKALMIVCGCNLFEWGTFLRRMDNFLMDIYIDSKNAEILIENLMERHLATLEKVCESVGDVVDILRFGDDLGMDTGPFMSPEKYKELFFPRHRRLNEYVHKHSNMKTFLHSCGSIYSLLPYLIDAGYDIINPVQTVSSDMEPKRLKQEFGRDITFWGGGCNTRNILNRGTPKEVYEYSKRMIEIFFKNGGFVFNQEHNILPDVPPENILSMMHAVSEYK